MSFYRTYRPQVIDEIDNASVRERLSEFLTKDRKHLPHAFLFTGPKGAGKTTAARVIAKIFNCVRPNKKGEPCGECEQCRAIADGTSLDVIEMDAASNRGIDEIRTLRQRIGLAPASASFTVYIIDEVHMLTTEAFNALLKTLEEPPAHAVFVLATTNREKVPATIQSRCINITFTKASRDELIHALSRIAKAEKLDADEAAFVRIADAADGSFRDAVKYLEQMSLSGKKITVADVVRTLSLSDDAFRKGLLAHLAARDAGAALTSVRQAVEEGRDMRVLLTDLLMDLEARLVASVTGGPKDVWTREMLADAIVRFTRAFGELKISPVPHLPLELAVVDFCIGTGTLHAEEPAPGKTEPVAQTHAIKKDDHAQSGRSDTPEPKKQEAPVHEAPEAAVTLGLITLEKLKNHWPDFIASMKPYNHSVAGVLRSSRPKSVDGGIVTIEAFYKFHQEKLAEAHTRQILSDVLKKLFGEKVKVEVVLGRK